MTAVNLKLLPGESIPVGVVPLEADMVAFDALPPMLRRRLSVMALNWNAAGVETIRAKVGDETALAVLDKVDGDMMDAYERRLPCLAR